MITYPSVRYAVVNGELKSEVIHNSHQERPGWEPTPHRFRPLTVAEFIRMGHSGESAATAHQRELRRVKLIFAGHSLEDADRLADSAEEDPPAAVSYVSALEAEVSRLKAELAQKDEALAAKQAEMDQMVERFNANWQKLTTENATLRKQAKGKAKHNPSPTEDSPAQA